MDRKTALTELAKLQSAKAAMAQGKLARAEQDVNLLRGKLEALQEERALVSSPSEELSEMKSVGADNAYRRWVEQTAVDVRANLVRSMNIKLMAAKRNSIEHGRLEVLKEFVQQTSKADSEKRRANALDALMDTAVMLKIRPD